MEQISLNDEVQLRVVKAKDHLILRKIYIDAIQSRGPQFYSEEQINAWVSLASLPGVLDSVFGLGQGWLIVVKHEIEAFSVRYPMNRLALLYCRGRSERRGYASALIKKIESEAVEAGIFCLFTEASMFSYPLFLKYDWQCLSIENIKIGGVAFQRYRMCKNLKP